MQIACTVSTTAILAALLWAPNAVLAQCQTAGTPLKTIGSTVKTQMVPSLIVMNAQGATLQGQKLTPTGVAPNSIVFADRPVLSAGHALTTHLLEEWDESAGDSFAKNPPNATVSVLSKDAASIRDAVAVLKSPQMAGDRLTFDVQVLEGDLTGADGPAAVFIDIVGMPLTPLSSAGSHAALPCGQPGMLEPWEQPRRLTIRIITRHPTAITARTCGAETKISGDLRLAAQSLRGEAGLPHAGQSMNSN